MPMLQNSAWLTLISAVLETKSKNKFYDESLCLCFSPVGSPSLSTHLGRSKNISCTIQLIFPSLTSIYVFQIKK